MTHDELMQFTDLQRRVIALEAQAKADNDMTFAKAPTILNRLLEAHNRIDELERCKIYQEDNNVGQSKRIDALESKLQRDREESMCDMCKMFEQLSDAHNAICDVLFNLIDETCDQVMVSRSAYGDAIDKARLPQDNTLPSLKREDENEVLEKHGLQEAQDDRDSIDWREQDFDTQGAQDELASNDNSIDEGQNGQGRTGHQAVSNIHSDGDKSDTELSEYSNDVDAIMGEMQDDVIDVMSMASDVKTYRLVEVQDETTRPRNIDDSSKCSVRGADNVDGSVSGVDAIMREMRKSFSMRDTVEIVLVANRTIYRPMSTWELHQMEKLLRPTIERLVGERDEAVALSKNFYGIDVVIRQREEQRERAERAEAERDAEVRNSNEQMNEIVALTEAKERVEAELAQYLDDSENFFANIADVMGLKESENDTFDTIIKDVKEKYMSLSGDIVNLRETHNALKKDYQAVKNEMASQLDAIHGYRQQSEEAIKDKERAEAQRDEFITKNDEKFREIQMLTKECGELEKDKARLDYLDDHWISAECSAFGNWYISGKYCPPDESDPVDVEEDGETLRQAIDNAMKEANDAE